MPWSTPFREPIVVPKGKPLRTLSDARAYALKHHTESVEWGTAADLLMKAADTGGLWVDMAGIAMFRAIKQKLPL